LRFTKQTTDPRVALEQCNFDEPIVFVDFDDPADAALCKELCR
jgi:hypothetical protein